MLLRFIIKIRIINTFYYQYYLLILTLLLLIIINNIIFWDLFLLNTQSNEFIAVH